MSVRRETLLRPPTDVTSAIPKPSTSKMMMPPPSVPALQRPASRQSLAPGRAPAPHNANMGSSTGPRQSMYPSANPLLMSARKGGAGFGTTPGRRTSMWGGSMAPPLPGVNQPVKDTRPIRDRAFQAQIGRVIHNFCTSNGCPTQLAPKLATSPPTTSQYYQVVDWIVRILDPEYPAAVGANEFINVLKWFRYPFVDAIDKKSLSTVGGLHSWPGMLAALHYLVLLGMARINYGTRKDEPTLQDPEQVPEVFGDEIHHWALAFHYYNCAYGSFLSGSDEFPNERKELEDRYAKKDAEVSADLTQKRSVHAQLSADLVKLSGTSAPVLKLREDWRRIHNDQEKFVRWRQHSESRILRYQEELVRENQTIAEDESKLGDITNEQLAAEAEVAKQKISPEEVQRMTAEDGSLDRILSDLKIKSKDASKSALNLEVMVSNRTESAEQAVQEYMGLVYTLGLHPKPPSEFASISFYLELTSGSSNPNDLYSGENLRETIKPALVTLADLRRRERGEHDLERVQLEDNLDRLTLDCENLEQEVATIDARVRLSNTEAENARDTAQREAHSSHMEITRLEKEVAQARAGVEARNVDVTARLQAAQIAYRVQVDKTDRLREDTVRAVVKSTSEMCAFKEQVSEYLNHLRQIAEDN